MATKCKLIIDGATQMRIFSGSRIVDYVTTPRNQSTVKIVCAPWQKFVYVEIYKQIKLKKSYFCSNWTYLNIGIKHQVNESLCFMGKKHAQENVISQKHSPCRLFQAKINLALIFEWHAMNKTIENDENAVMRRTCEHTYKSNVAIRLSAQIHFVRSFYNVYVGSGTCFQ